MVTIDLNNLVDKEIFEKFGITERGTEYVLKKQRANNGLMKFHQTSQSLSERGRSQTSSQIRKTN